MSESALAELAGVVGAGGAAFVLLAGRRVTLLAGFALLAGAELLLGLSMAGTDIVDDPARYGAAVAEMTQGTGAYDAAAVFAVGSVIDPRGTRSYLKSALRVHGRRTGKHHLSNWPTTIY